MNMGGGYNQMPQQPMKPQANIQFAQGMPQQPGAHMIPQQQHSIPNQYMQAAM